MMDWFKQYRSIFNHEIWLNVTDYRLFTLLIGKAHFGKTPIRKGSIEIRRGQFLRSYRKLQYDLRYKKNRQIREYSLSEIKRSISRLSNMQCIAYLETELGTLFTILNYDKYQANQSKNNDSFTDDEDVKAELGTELGTNLEQLANNNKNDLKNNIIEIAFRLIEKVNHQPSLYSIISKFRSRLGEAKLIEILGGLSLKHKSFANENRLAAYLETCTKNNGHIGDALPELSLTEPGYL